MEHLQSSSLDDLYNKLVSFQKNAWSPLSKEISIAQALKEIKSDKYKQQVLGLRSLLEIGDRENYNSHKKNLPAITFCGTFNRVRKKEDIKCYNSLIVLDIDELVDDEYERVKKCFLSDPYIFAFWNSPSKKGFKGLVFIKYSFKVDEQNVDLAHRIAFKILTIYIRETHNVQLDISGSDTTRLCFFSFDPNLKTKSKITEFEVAEIDIFKSQDSTEVKVYFENRVHINNRDALSNPKDRNNPKDRYTIQSIIRYLEKKQFSITYSYEQWYKVAMAIANTFTYDIGEKYFVKLSSLDKGKFIKENCKNFLQSCYESRNGAIKFSTIIYYANENGYLTKKQRERGSEVADESLSQVSSS
jgi:hypothetical protein